MNKKYGMFNPMFRVAGDWEMWCRAVEGGAKLLKIPGVYCLYYFNPEGLSTDRSRWNNILIERDIVYKKYSDLWKDL